MSHPQYVDIQRLFMGRAARRRRVIDAARVALYVAAGAALALWWLS
jgi:hypothetical protein